ncbi:MAG TPA: alpha/beta hydrolase [Thermoleophilaceae bacterium]|nr:alpha/beta hydrolase [Thermoleophilaceae bacterium]
MTAPPDVPGARHTTVSVATADAGAIDLHVLEAGEPGKPPVLLLHGYPQHAWCWRHVIPLLAPHHRLIAPDLRGFGWSDCPEGGYDPVTFAADAVALLDALEIEQADVVGHDWGGSTAFALALTAPERVRRMVILNTIAPWVRRSPRLIAQARRSWYTVAMALVGDVVLRRRPQMVAENIRKDAVHPSGMTEEDAMAYALRLGEPARARASKLLYRTYLKTAVGRAPGPDLSERRLTQPTRFLFGVHDAYVAPVTLEGVEEHGDDLTLEMVEDSGHFIAEEKPELVARRALDLFGA